MTVNNVLMEIENLENLKYVFKELSQWANFKGHDKVEEFAEAHNINIPLGNAFSWAYSTCDEKIKEYKMKEVK